MSMKKVEKSNSSDFSIRLIKTGTCIRYCADIFICAQVIQDYNSNSSINLLQTPFLQFGMSNEVATLTYFECYLNFHSFF